MPSGEIEFSVVIPAYNEAERILPTLNITYTYLKSKYRTFEIVVVNDGSKDKTAEIVSHFAQNCPETRLISFESNKGKGAAVKTGMLASLGSLILFQDADGATPISELEKLLSGITEAEVAIGSRAIPSADTKVVTILHRKILGRLFNFTANLFAVPGIHDTQCGFKLFKAHAAKEIFSRQKLDGFGFDVELLYIAKKLGYKIREIAVNWHNMPGTKVNVVKDGFLMFYEIVLIKLLHRSSSF